MPVKIRVYGKEAVFHAGCWDCDDEVLREMLQSMVDPRGAFDADREREHAQYAAGRLGGLLLTPTGWVAAEHPEPEIRMEDLVPARQPREGLFSRLQKRLRHRG